MLPGVAGRSNTTTSRSSPLRNPVEPIVRQSDERDELLLVLLAELAHQLVGQLDVVVPAQQLVGPA
jgi:hypothetical protein